MPHFRNFQRPFCISDPHGSSPSGTSRDFDFSEAVWSEDTFSEKKLLCYFFPFQCRYNCNAPGLNKSVFWNTLRIWKRNVLDIDINENNIDILLGIPNPNKDKNISFLNFVNLCAKNYIRESEDLSVFVNVLLVKMKAWCESIKFKDVNEMFDEFL